jgi:hypothetical protein
MFFHTAHILDPLDFYVKDQPPSLTLTPFVLFAVLWGMPLLCVVSGLGAWYSLRSRTATGFIRERLARLLVPFLVGLLLGAVVGSTAAEQDEVGAAPLAMGRVAFHIRLPGYRASMQRAAWVRRSWVASCCTGQNARLPSWQDGRRSAGAVSVTIRGCPSLRLSHGPNTDQESAPFRSRRPWRSNLTR